MKKTLTRLFSFGGRASRRDFWLIGVPAGIAAYLLLSNGLDYESAVLFVIGVPFYVASLAVEGLAVNFSGQIIVVLKLPIRDVGMLKYRPAITKSLPSFPEVTRQQEMLAIVFITMAALLTAGSIRANSIMSL